MQLARIVQPQLSSSAIRKSFIDYFCSGKGHQHIRSSPVLPFGDPTLAFTNAGMNQFKGILQGISSPTVRRVANYQKCIRVGGKHNDLAIVGRDGTHHTFFEMLGNWSFGDYFKKESCIMAWELLTEVYNIDPSRLRVTYFGGDEMLNLPPDEETREIWRMIGLPENYIIPGSLRDNFWEMGESGPCGACTEIHYETGEGGDSRLLEVWNLVFVEYNRESDGSLTKLGMHHVDTGMGLERLTAILQEKNSNYDTDLFIPLFEQIHRSTGFPPYGGCFGSDDEDGLDTAYRILADHSRMLTVSLADGFFPDQEGKLRGIIRKALTVARDKFNEDAPFIKDLSSVVAEVLNDAYPEIGRNIKRVHHFIDHEAEVLTALRVNTAQEFEKLREEVPSISALSIDECPNLLPAYQRLTATLGPNPTGEALQPSVVFKLCETYGVPLHLAEQLASAVGMSLDVEALEAEALRSKLEGKKEMLKEQNKAGTLSPALVQKLKENHVEITNDQFKYEYLFNFDEKALIPTQTASIVALIVDGELLDFVSPELIQSSGKEIGVIFDRTNMYSESGGQVADSGVIEVEKSNIFSVLNVINTGGYVVHWVKCKQMSEEGVRVGNLVKITIDEVSRRGVMRNHTATHILNAALRKFLSVTEQKSSRVTANKLSFDFSVYRENLTVEDLENIEKVARQVIQSDVPVRRFSVSNDQLNSLDPLTVVPGEVYPHEAVHLVEISSGEFFSREPCCGTHVVRTSELGDFVITHYKALSSSVKSITAVTGEQAVKAAANQDHYKERFRLLKSNVLELMRTREYVDKKTVESCETILRQFIRNISSTELMSFIAKSQFIEDVEELKAQLKNNERESLRTSLVLEMRNVIQSNQKKYLVHYLECSSVVDNVPLQKASKLCGNVPSIIFVTDNGLVKARCCVPQEKVTDKFSAHIWLDFVINKIGARGGPPKGQDPDLVYNMKGKKLTKRQLDAALLAAKSFADNSL